MWNSFKKKISNIKFRRPDFNLRLRIEKFDLRILALMLLVQAVIFGLSLYKNQFEFNISFIRSNYVQLIVITLLLTFVFQMSYFDSVKKSPNLGLYIIFLLITALFTYNIVGVTSLIESYSGRAMFSTANYVFVYLSLILMGLIYARFDMPISTNLKELYVNFRSNFYKHFGLVLALTGIVALRGFIDRTFVYAAAFILMIDSVYLAKFFLANLKK